MKRLFTLIATVICTLMTLLSVKAQENESFRKSIFLEFGAGYACHDKYKSALWNETRHEGSAMLTPMVGYRFHPRWAAGFGVTFPVGEDRLYGPMPQLFVSYDFLKINDFSVFAQLQGMWGADRNDYDGGTPRYTDMWECGMRFGASYRFSNHISANIRYLFIGYSRRASADRYRRGVVGDHDFIMDAGVRPLQLSLRYTF